MKIKILSQKKQENNVVNLDIEIREDDGTLVFSGTRGFVSQGTTEEEVMADLKTSFENIYISEINKQNAVLADVVSSLVNQEISL